MHYAQIGFRLAQRLLMYPTIGNLIQKFRNLLESSGYVSKETMRRYIRTMFSYNSANFVTNIKGNPIDLGRKYWFSYELYSNRLSRKQLGEIWGSKYTDSMDKDIEHILDLIEYNGGHLITDKTMSYLMDRYVHYKLKILFFVSLFPIEQFYRDLVWTCVTF